MQAATTIELRPVFDQLWLLRKTHHRLQGDPARARPGGALTCIGRSPAAAGASQCIQMRNDPLILVRFLCAAKSPVSASHARAQYCCACAEPPAASSLNSDCNHHLQMGDRSSCTAATRSRRRRRRRRCCTWVASVGSRRSPWAAPTRRCRTIASLPCRATGCCSTGVRAVHTTLCTPGGQCHDKAWPKPVR